MLKTALFSLLVLLAGGMLHAQTMLPLPAHGSTYSASQVRGFWFTAPTDFVIVGVRVPTDVGTTAQNVQIIKFANTPPAYPTTATGTTLGYWNNVAGTSIIPCYVEIQAGDHIAIFGARDGGGTTNLNSYATPSGNYTSSILGQSVTLERMVWQSGTWPIGACSRESGGTIARTEVYYIPPVTGPDDAGVYSIDSPLNFCAGNEDVTVTLRNYGTNPLTSATINWTLNGVPQTPYNWTGMLDTVSITTRSTQVTLASMNFQSGMPYTITAWPTMPNGVQDTVPRNDTASVTVQAAIAGTFTIGGASPDYPDFTSAVDDLNNYGLCGPVVFNVRPGSYNERFELGDIAGSSATNTITFQSETGNRGDVNLTYNATGTADNGIVTLNGVRFATFRNMTMTAQSASYGRVVVMDGSSTDNRFEGCELVTPTVTTTSTNVAVVYSPSGTMNHRHSFVDCGIRGGSYGMYLYGSGSSSTEDGLLVSDCEFTEQYYMGYRGYYCGEVTFVDNYILINSSYSSKYIAQFYYGYNTSIERNVMISDGGSYGYGVYIYYDGYYQTGNSRFVNNMVSVLNTTSTTYGVRPYNNENMFFAHNTVHVNGSSTSSRAVYTYNGASSQYLNNIMYHTGAGVAWYVNSPSAITASDYNLLYSNGSNLAYWSGNRTDLAALQTASGMDANSISKTVSFVDEFNGDLHLASPSDDDTDLFGTLLPEVVDDIDGEKRVNPYRGADEACYVTPGSLNYSFVDAAGMPAAYAEAPGSIGVRYSVTFPEFASTVTFTVQFFDVSTNTLAYQTSFQASKAFGTPLSGTQYITLPASLQAGSYKIEVIFNTKNSCDVYRDYMPY
ncbi:MAG: hypothetical protein RRA94_10385, partial [Bacteroidota bacterium]|nr:hypothetical protein [Bacteroidota bacterium]